MAKKYSITDIEDARTQGEDNNGWLITLSDLMMLLLTFFVMLFMVIEPSDQDYVGVLRKVGDALGGKSLVERKTNIEQIKEKFEALVKDNNLVRQAQITTDSRGIVLFAEGDLFFKPGTAELTDDIRFFLKRIAGVLKETRYKVVVEGHTDDVPIKSEIYPSNWELSTARASTVVRYLLEKNDMEPRRFAAVGYAHHKPRYAFIPENRPRNRRVEIVILREEN